MEPFKNKLSYENPRCGGGVGDRGAAPDEEGDDADFRCGVAPVRGAGEWQEISSD